MGGDGKAVRGVVVHGEWRKAQIPGWVLQVLESVSGYFEEIVVQKLGEEGMPAQVVLHMYLHDRNAGDWDEKSVSVYTIKVGEFGQRDDRDRAISCGVTYWRRFQDVRYHGKFSVDLIIESGKNPMLDSEIWLLEYMYRNDEVGFWRLFSGKEWRVVRWSRGTSDWYYLYYFFGKEEVEYAKALLKEIVDWVFSRLELKAVLRGDRWIGGYVPPVPL